MLLWRHLLASTEWQDLQYKLSSVSLTHPCSLNSDLRLIHAKVFRIELKTFKDIKRALRELLSGPDYEFPASITMYLAFFFLINTEGCSHFSPSIKHWTGNSETPAISFISQSCLNSNLLFFKISGLCCGSYHASKNECSRFVFFFMFHCFTAAGVISILLTVFSFSTHRLYEQNS